MPEQLQHGGSVRLWGGWFIDLPPCNYQRNPDMSWSAWGADWAADVHIIETSGKDGQPVAAENLLDAGPNDERISGRGWIGKAEVLTEEDAGRHVLRLATKLCAENTFMSCWISYFHSDQRGFADSIVRGVHWRRHETELAPKRSWFKW